MDFDSIITFFFIFIFFVLPSIFKMLAKKKQTSQKASTKKKPSVLGKIGEQIQNFIRELEEQAQQQRQPAGEGQQQDQSFWETFTEDETVTEDDYVYLKEDKIEDEEAMIPPQVPTETPADISALSAEKVMVVSEKPIPLKKQVRQGFRTNTLQNAVIWSEILSKPIALREK